MKMLLAAIAMTIAAPALAQTAAPADAHANHANHTAHAAPAAHNSHADHEMAGECCDKMAGGKTMPCCEKMKAAGKKMDCCEKQAPAAADPHDDHDRRGQ